VLLVRRLTQSSYLTLVRCCFQLSVFVTLFGCWVVCLQHCRTSVATVITKLSV